MMQSKYFRTCLGIIALLLIIYLTTKISFLFQPLVSIFNMLLVPMAISGFFFYLLRPIVDHLERRKIKRPLGVLLIYFVFAGLFAIFVVTIWPTLQEQIENFVMNAPNLVQDLQKQMTQLQQSSFFGRFMPSESEIYTRATEIADQAMTWISNSLTNLITVVSNVFIILATVPIILYYMLKESDKLPPKLLGILPRRFRRDGQEVLKEIDGALSNFIIGKVILNLVLSILIYIGFLIIGLPYSLLLTLISFVLNFIPYVGALLATIPVVIVGFIESPSIAIWSVVVIVIAQQIQDNILTPVIYGKQLDIHPLTTIILLLVGGNFFGMLGVLLAIPAYMVIKIVVVRVYELFVAEKVENA
ncbi:AI-2E family transporter [Paenibacillus lemnae]|uniref:AI-2E family transporter n=1 Tax=Paenibacillus lemnae TaxID=1330551 RepID=A0A848M3R4_PAELE|nr:AI-2E family transporter [Paenibacillus lemnae]NMO94732.1 AI-2E family transporter [Paenibacillus lemnae]